MYKEKSNLIDFNDKMVYKTMSIVTKKHKCQLLQRNINLSVSITSSIKRKHDDEKRIEFDSIGK